MLGRLDRYVGKAVLGSYLTTLLFVVFLFVVFDLLLRMGKYLEAAEQQGVSIISLLFTWAQFHLLSLPWIFVTLAPFVTVIGSMFAISRFMGANEVVPMLFTGRGMVRVLSPALVMGALSAGSMAASWEFVLPQLLEPMNRLQQRLDPDDDAEIDGIALFSKDRDKVLLCNRYHPEMQRMDGVKIVDTSNRLPDGQLAALVVTSARTANWNPEKKDWELTDGVRRGGGTIEDVEYLGLREMTPELVWLSGKEEEASSLLSYSELRALIEVSPRRPDLVIAFHYHLTWPLANLVLLLLVLPFAVQFERGSSIGRVMLAILVCGAYLMVDLTCQNLGRGEYLHPIVAAWTPPILFGSLGLVMFGGMRT